MIAACDITGLVLAGGQGSRMGGVDKGLQRWHDVPLALHAARRLAPQVGTLAMNANRHLDDYRGFGWPVWSDALPGHAGPLAGMLAGLTHCQTPWLASVPCDSPMFPIDLVERLAAAVSQQQATIAVASAPDAAGVLRRQPVFCLLHRSAQASLANFLAEGGRKIGAWLSAQGAVAVPFGPPRDTASAFANVNTLAELVALAQQQRPVRAP